MSEQVVFTKEEVEKIRTTLKEARHIIDFHAFRYVGTYPQTLDPIDEAVSILDSPRPRPKVPMDMLEDCGFIDFADKESWQNAASGYALRYGFDVED